MARVADGDGVIVAHPLVQHSYQTCAALAEGGLLDAFFTSIYDTHAAHRVLPGRLARLMRKRWHPGIPSDRVVSFPLIEAAYRAAMAAAPARARERLLYSHFRAFDRAVARGLEARRARVVVGYENSARETFAAARRLGMTCVLDAASVHYRTQRAVLPARSDGELRARMEERKQAEIDLADEVVVLSTFARDTYAAAGVPESRITVIPLGIDSTIAPPARRRPRDAALRFVFAGNLTYAKGVDLLLAALASLPDLDCELVLVGARGDAAAAISTVDPRVRFAGYLDRAALMQEYADADVLVLPSRCDGFGQVVPEAMHAAIPCIVSTHVGAKDLVEEGATGWIFASGDVAALARCLLAAQAARANLAEMGTRASERVRVMSWDSYHAEVRDYYRALLSKTQRGAPAAVSR